MIDLVLCVTVSVQQHVKSPFCLDEMEALAQSVLRDYIDAINRTDQLAAISEKAEQRIVHD